MIRTITPIFSIIISIVIFFSFSKPMFVEIESLQNETTKFEEAAARASELNTELSSKLDMKRSYPAEALERLEVLVPDTINEIKILNDLNERAKAHNLLFGNVSLSKADPAMMREEEAPIEAARVITYDNLLTSDITFSLIGSYDQFKAFLTDLEQSLLMIEVTNLEFTAGEGILQQYEVTARVFALPPIE
jgi:hypothetical protein